MKPQYTKIRRIAGRRRLAAVALWIGMALVLGGCTGVAINPAAINGEWRFAYVGQAKTAGGKFPPPPQFDTIIFRPPTGITLTSNTRKASFEGVYTLTGERMTYEFQPPGVARPIRHTFTCALSKQGQALLLAHQGVEMVYYRPNRFFPNDIAGEWTARASNRTETMRLGPDGSYRLMESKVEGHYRLWPSRFGPAMTTLVTVPGRGGRMWLWQYERSGDRLTMIPIAWDGPVRQGRVSWTRKAARGPLQLSQQTPGWERDAF